MKIGHESPRRPPLRFYGGKWMISEWIIGFFVEHECYVEPFCGGASILLRKPRSHIEIINDLNQDVVHFFKILRERPEELINAIMLTPWSRVEYALSHEPADDPLERARRFYVSAWQGFGGGRATWRQGWRYQVGKGSVWKPSALSFREVDHLWQTVDRLRGVQIECRDAFKLIPACDRPTTLFYLDPPYVHGTRSKWRDTYAHEMTDEEHVKLAELARSLEGFVLISGYPSDLYRELYEDHGWHRVETESRTGGGGSITSVERTEALWISPRTWRRHQQEERQRSRSIAAQLPMFRYQ